MINGRRLKGIRTRNEAMARIEAVLQSPVGDNSWRVRIQYADRVQVGDRLRFGETSENLACLLGFLDADVIEKDGDQFLLSFHFTGAVLEDALRRLGEAAP